MYLSYAPTPTPEVDHRQTIFGLEESGSGDSGSAGPGTEYGCGWDLGAGECRTGEVTDDAERQGLLEARPGACSHYTSAPTVTPSASPLPLQLRYESDFNTLFPLASRTDKIESFKATAADMIKLATGSNTTPDLAVSEGSVLLTVDYGDQDLQDALARAARACTLSMVFESNQMRPSLTGTGERNCNAELAASKTTDAEMSSSAFWWIILAVVGAFLLIWLAVHMKLTKTKKGSSKVNPDAGGMPVLPARGRGSRSSHKKNAVGPQEQKQEEALSTEEKVTEALMDLDSDPAARSKINSILADELYIVLGPEDPVSIADAYLKANLDLSGAKQAASETQQKLKSGDILVDLLAENCLKASQDRIAQLEKELVDIEGDTNLSDEEIARQACAAKIRLRLAQEALKRQQNLKNALIMHDRLAKQLISTHTPLEEQDMARVERTARIVEAAEDTEAACQSNVDLLERELTDLEADSSLSDGEIARRARAAKIRLRLAKEDLLRQHQLRHELILQSKLAQKMIDAHHLVVDAETAAASTLLEDHIAVMEEDFKALSFEPSDTASFFGSLRHKRRASLGNPLLASSSFSGRTSSVSVTSENFDMMLDEKVAACQADIDKLEKEISDVESDDSLSDDEINKCALAARMRLRLAKAELHRQEQLRMELIMRNKLAQRLLLLTKASVEGSSQRIDDGTLADLNEEIETQRKYLTEQLPDQRIDADKTAEDAAEVEVSRLEDELRGSTVSSKDTAALERRLQVARLQLRLARDRAKRARLAQMQAHLRNRSLQKLAAANKMSNDAEEEVQLLSEMLEETKGLESAQAEVEVLASECQSLLPEDGPAVHSVGDGSMAEQQRQLTAAQLKLQSARKCAELHRKKQLEAKLRLRQIAVLSASTNNESVVQQSNTDLDLRTVEEQEDNSVVVTESLPATDAGMVPYGTQPESDPDDLSVDAIQRRVKAAMLRQRVAANRAGREADIQRELRLHQKLTDDLVKTSDLAARHDADKGSLDSEFARLSKARSQALSQDQPAQAIDDELEQVASKLQLASERAMYCQSFAADTAAKMEPLFSRVEVQVQLVDGEEKDDMVDAMEILQNAHKSRRESTQPQDTAAAEDAWKAAKKAIQTEFSAELDQLADDEYAVRVAKTDAQTSLALQEKDEAELELKVIESETSPSDQSELETRVKVARLRVRLAKERAQKSKEAQRQWRERELLVSRLVATEKQAEKALEIEKLIVQTMESPASANQTDELTARLALARERALFAEERRASLLGELRLASDADAGFESTNAAEMLVALDELERAEDGTQSFIDSSSDDDVNPEVGVPELQVESVRPTTATSRPGTAGLRTPLGEAAQRKQAVRMHKKRELAQKRAERGADENMRRKVQQQVVVKARAEASRQLKTAVQQELARDIDVAVSTSKGTSPQRRRSCMTSVVGDGFMEPSSDTPLERRDTMRTTQTATQKRLMAATAVANNAKRGWLMASAGANRSAKVPDRSVHAPDSTSLKIAEVRKNLALEMVAELEKQNAAEEEQVAADAGKARIAAERRELEIQASAAEADHRRHESEDINKKVNLALLSLAGIVDDQPRKRRGSRRNSSLAAAKALKQWRRQHKQGSADIGVVLEMQTQKNKNMGDLVKQMKEKESAHSRQKELASLGEFSTENPWAVAGDQLEAVFRGIPRRRSAIERDRSMRSPTTKEPDQLPPAYPLHSPLAPFGAVQSTQPVAPTQLPGIRHGEILPLARLSGLPGDGPLPSLRGPGAGPRSKGSKATVLHDL